jgi:hypothetical protein
VPPPACGGNEGGKFYQIIFLIFIRSGGIDRMTEYPISLVQCQSLFCEDLP